MPPTPYQYPANQVHSMQQFGPICMQRWPLLQLEPNSTGPDLQLGLMGSVLPAGSLARIGPLYRLLAQRQQSEDCLNLNIYLAQKALPERAGGAHSRTGLPVLVLVHGDSFEFGAGSALDGAGLVRRHNNLLVVTFNYRLNILGFPPQLAGTALRANLGLMDQVAALHWIKDNIGSFGGSAGDVSLLASKRAALLVNLLALSHLAKGLFRRIIIEDGSALSPVVANQVASDQLSSSQTGAQHLRMLAKLCQCHWMGSNLSEVGPISGAGEMSGWRSGRTLDCLKRRPVEQIMQPIPMHLLRSDPASGQLVIQRSWLRNLSSEGSPQLQEDAVSGDHQEVQVDSRLLSRLVRLAHQEQLDRPAGSSSELFRALYASPKDSARPLFGPTIDGALVPGEDLASLMLKPGSPFSQRDLMIGLTQPLLASSSLPTPEAHSLTKSPPEAQPISDLVQIRPEHLLSDWLDTQTQQSGLSNEQALQLVNSFVRSFYRYHNQEITNSIINHYLGQANLRLVQQHLSSSSKLMAATVADQSQHGYQPKSSQQTGAAQVNLLQHLLMLDGLMEAFHDALTSVPVFKTALIHATRQLDSLLAPLVSEQFELWKQEVHSSNWNQFNKTRLLDLLISHGRGLIGAKLQPGALNTYLYQFEPAPLVHRVSLVLSSLRAQSLDSANEPIMGAIRWSLEKLVNSLKSSQFRDQLSLDCVWSRYQDQQTSRASLLTRFMDWLCLDQLGSIISQFATSGSIKLQPYWPTPVSEPDSASEQRLKLCLSSSGPPVAPVDLNWLQKGSQDDSSPGSSPGQSLVLDERCQDELDSAALLYLLQQLANQERGSLQLSSSANLEPSDDIWTPFSLFNQRVALFPILSTFESHLRSIGAELEPYGDRRRPFMERASFWSNFVPSLNCSKTQPIIPSPMLLANPLLGPTNSSLLSLNLQFSCQYGPITAYSELESLAGLSEQLLETRIDQWAKSMNRSLQIGASQRQHEQLKQQNHHSLRMVNISQAQSALGSEPQGDGLSLGPSSAPSAPSFAGAEPDSAMKAVELRTKYAGLVLVICGVLVSLTLASGLCALVKQRKQAISNTSSSSSSSNNTTNNNNNNNNNNGSDADDPIVTGNNGIRGSSLARDNPQRGSSASSASSSLNPSKRPANQPEPANQAHLDMAQTDHQPILIGSGNFGPTDSHFAQAMQEQNVGLSQLDYGMYGCVQEQKELQRLMGPAVLNQGQHHTCQASELSGQGFLVWDRRDQRFLFHDRAYRAEPSSQLDSVGFVASDELILGRAAPPDAQGDGSGQHREPIGLQSFKTHSHPSHQSATLGRKVCPTNAAASGGYGSLAVSSSTAKKRVKISDQICTLTRGSNGLSGKQQDLLTLPDSTSRALQSSLTRLDTNPAVYCPIHQDKSTLLAINSNVLPRKPISVSAYSLAQQSNDNPLWDVSHSFADNLAHHHTYCDHLPTLNPMAEPYLEQQPTQSSTYQNAVNLDQTNTLKLGSSVRDCKDPDLSNQCRGH